MHVAQADRARRRALLEVKADMLCRGVRAAPETGQAVVGLGLTPGFIHGAVILLDGTEVVNTSLLEQSVGSDGVRLQGQDGRLVVQRDGFEFESQLLALPETLNVPLGHSRLPDFFSLHSPSTLFAAPLRQCIFISAAAPCTFCTFESGRLQALSVLDFERALVAVLEQVPGLVAVAIGGGTPNITDRGAAYYAALTQVAKRLGLEVSVELVPPARTADLDLLMDAGVDALIMSLEVWDDDLRGQICLGKSKVASKQHYFLAWNYALGRLGTGRVSSVLLVGTEPPPSTREGAAALVDAGVIPTLIPYRRYDASMLDLEPVKPLEYLAQSQYLASLLARKGLDPAAQPGCTACGGCSLEVLGARQWTGEVQRG